MLAAMVIFALRLPSAEAYAATPELPFRHYTEPIFPLPLLSTTVTRGHATVSYMVSVDGKVEDALTIAASHPSFGRAVTDAMRSWEIDPSSLVPGRRETVQFLFVREHAVTSLTQGEAAKTLFSPSQDNAMAVQTVSWADLSSPPQRLAFVAPSYPDEARARHLQGSATVNFFIDENGAVRLPTVTRADDLSFGRELLRAVRQWRFAPPLSQGRPVQVQVERQFSFAVR
jgi:TonB family protein